MKQLLEFHLRREREAERERVLKLDAQKQREDEERIANGRKEPLPPEPDDFIGSRTGCSLIRRSFITVGSKKRTPALDELDKWSH
jgi:hypothetical protein